MQRTGLVTAGVLACILSTSVFAQQPAASFIQLTIAPNPAAPDQSVEFKVDASTDAAHINAIDAGGGITSLERYVRDIVVDETTVAIPAACNTVDGYWQEVVKNPASGQGTTGRLVHTKNAPAEPGDYGYRGKFANASSGFASNETTCINLKVEDDCDIPLSIVVKSGATGLGITGGYAEWETVYEVAACEAFSGVTAQGGINAKQKADSLVFTPSAGTMDLRKATGRNNEVWIWGIGLLNAGEKATLKVVVSKPLPKHYAKNCLLGTIETDLLGSWSVSYVDGAGVKRKADEVAAVRGVYPECTE